MASDLLFERFIVRNGKGNVDVNGILSRECYLAWLENKEKILTDPEEAFRKTITGHCNR